MRIICGALVLALGFLVPICPAQPTKGGKLEKEPITSIGGKNLEQWKQQLTSTDASKRADAVVAICQFGDENGRCVPAILGMAAADKDVSPRVRALIAMRILNIPDDQLSRVIRTLGDRLNPTNETQSVARLEAAVSLRRFTGDPELAQIQSALILGSRDRSSWEIRFHCVSLLWRLGKEQQKSGADAKIYEGLLAVFDQNRSETYLVKLEAMQGIGALGRPNNPLLLNKLVTTLSSFTQSANKPLAIWAYTALVAMHDGSSAEVYLTGISKFLQSDNLEYRIQAAGALGALSTRAKRKVPQLVAMLKDRETNAVVAAANALGAIGDSNDKVVDALLELLDHKDPTRASGAVNGLVGLKLNTSRVMGAMDKMLERKDLDRRLRAYIEDGMKEIKTPKKK